MLQFSAPNIPDALKREQQLILECDRLRREIECKEAEIRKIRAERVRIEAETAKIEAELEEYRKRFGPLSA